MKKEQLEQILKSLHTIRSEIGKVMNLVEHSVDEESFAYLATAYHYLHTSDKDLLEAIQQLWSYKDGLFLKWFTPIHPTNPNQVVDFISIPVEKTFPTESSEK